MSVSFDFSKFFGNVSSNISSHWDAFKSQGNSELNNMSDVLGMPSENVAETMNLMKGSIEDIKGLYNGFCGINNNTLKSESDVLYKDNPHIRKIDLEFDKSINERLALKKKQKEHPEQFTEEDQQRLNELTENLSEIVNENKADFKSALMEINQRYWNSNDLLLKDEYLETRDRYLWPDMKTDNEYVNNLVHLVMTSGTYGDVVMPDGLTPEQQQEWRNNQKNQNKVYNLLYTTAQQRLTDVMNNINNESAVAFSANGEILFGAGVGQNDVAYQGAGWGNNGARVFNDLGFTSDNYDIYQIKAEHTKREQIYNRAVDAYNKAKESYVPEKKGNKTIPFDQSTQGKALLKAKKDAETSFNWINNLSQQYAKNGTLTADQVKWLSGGTITLGKKQKSMKVSDFKQQYKEKRLASYGVESQSQLVDRYAQNYADEVNAYANWIGNYNKRAVTKNIIDPGNKQKVDTKFADLLQLKTPGWGYDEFINERNIFQKSLYTGVTEQGWWYFKIFFNFDTQYGLLGGILNNDGDPMKATNSAYIYLQNIVSRGQFERVMARKEALVKFVKILSYINTNAPWFFKDVKNLNQANIPLLNDFSKEKSIEIGCREDSIDMRLTTLLDLYKFVTYDEINQKEILPDNLRKFDMSVILFQVPLRYFHTAFITSDGQSYPYKNLNGDSISKFANMMSFKMFTFINCEIDINSLGSMIPGSVSNEKPFAMGGGSIKINYDRVYTHTFNEFNKLMFGSDGFHYNGDSSSELSKVSSQEQDNRVKAINYNMINSENKVGGGLYKGMVDASEYLCSHNYMGLGLDALGNIAGAENKALLGKKVNGKLQFTPNDYVKLKLKLLKSTNKTELLNELNSVSSGGDKFVQNLIDSYRSFFTTDNMWIAGAHETDITTQEGAAYWEEKIRNLRGKNIFKKLTNKIYSKLFNTSAGSIRSGSSNPSSRLEDTAMLSSYYMDKIRNLKNGTTNYLDGSGNNFSNVPNRKNVSSTNTQTSYPVNAFGQTNVTNTQQPINTQQTSQIQENEQNQSNTNTDYYINKIRNLKKGSTGTRGSGAVQRQAVTESSITNHKRYENRYGNTNIGENIMS